MNFIPITRGGSSPQGKPRVYFTCCPDDFKTLKPIAKDILDRQNCAIFYLPADEEVTDYEDYDLLLGQMQLFVVPVTEKLLHTPNRTKDYDIPFALREHIPVLPLMQEDGLAEQFNNKIGDLQFLDKNQNDLTAISFEEKLTRFLDSVIVGDELAEKVRSAFDAYVFLSYRKIDRVHANRLMRLIHDIEDYRDIAIWYDEYLVPGEDFRDAINEAFEKSALFALAVTPNVLIPGNFVKEEEYDMARKRRERSLKDSSDDKTFEIVPVELYDETDEKSRTDRAQLAIDFPGIPEVQDEHNRPRTNRAFLDALERIAKKENDGTPLHRFFIGLAYLNGIDVEVNHERAFELIEGAAKENCPEAMEKLVTMYRRGEGIARDYDEAIRWQRRLIEYLENRYNNDPSDDNAKDYLKQLSDLVEFLIEARLLEDAEQACGVICHFCVDKQYDKNWALGSMIWAFDRRSTLNRLLGKNDLSEAYAQKNVDYLRQAVKAVPDNYDIARMLGVSLNALGRAKLMEGKNYDAQKLLEESLALFEKLNEKHNTPATRRDVSATLNYLGNAYFQLQKMSDAFLCFKRMQELNRSIMLEEPDDVTRRDFAVSCFKLAAYYGAQQNYDEGISCMTEAIDAAEKVLENTHTFEALNDVQVCCDKLCQLYLESQQLFPARRYARKQLEIAEEVLRTRDCLEARVAVREAYDSMSRIYGGMNMARDAMIYLQKSVDAAKAVIELSDTPENQHSLATSLFNLGVVTSDRSCFKSAYDIWEKLYRSDPYSPMSQQLLQYMQMAKQYLFGR